MAIVQLHGKSPVFEVDRTGDRMQNIVVAYAQIDHETLL